MGPFCSIYKELEGKRVEDRGWPKVKRARELIVRSHQRFSERGT
jgi:hypothetical protein